MKPDLSEIGSALARKLDLDGLYLCGPFDSKGEPASSDIHILALSRRDDVIDLHYVPRVSGFLRRIEVSVVPARAVQAAIEEGVKTWFMFHTLDKMQRGKVITESPRTAQLRRRITQGLKLRPSLQAGVIRNVVTAGHALAGQAPGPAPANTAGGGIRASHTQLLSMLTANTLLLLSLSAYSVIRLKQTYSRHSELWLQVRHRVSGRLEPPTPGSAGKTMRTAERFLRIVLSRYGIEPGSMPTYRLGQIPAKD
jgi:hypothetical protein